MGRMPRYLFATLIALLAATALVACGGDDDGADASATAGPGTDPATVPSATPFGSDAIRYEISASGDSVSSAPLGEGSGSSGPSNSPSITAGTGEYVVQPGDSFFSIAGQFGITLDELLDLNDMTPDTVIQPGDVLRVPDPSAGTEGTATATPSGTPAEGGSTPEPAQDSAGGTTYTVAAGDSCASIAATFGISAQDLIAANDLPAACNTLQIGQELEIP
jgi:LysM repeat protein